MSGVQLIDRLNDIGGANGVGRLDLVENRLVGIKSREVYEAPAATILHFAHRELERLVLDKDTSHFKAKLAADYNRDLLVVPGSIFSAESKGVHQFLKLGATPITSVEDLLQALNLAPREKREILRGDVSDDEMRVIDALASPVSRNELIEALELPITEANILLSTMEIKGLIVEELGVVRVR